METSVTKTALYGLLTDWRIAGCAEAALEGCETSREACTDYIEEQEQSMVPFKVGEKHLIQTETLYWIGEIAEVSGGFLVLKPNCSWVHWTGRLSTLAKNLSFANKAWTGQRPRTEYVGRRVIVSLSKIVDSIEANWELPTESVTS